MRDCLGLPGISSVSSLVFFLLDLRGEATESRTQRLTRAGKKRVALSAPCDITWILKLNLKNSVKFNHYLFFEFLKIDSENHICYEVNVR